MTDCGSSGRQGGSRDRTDRFLKDACGPSDQPPADLAGLFFDAAGNDRTALIRGLVSHLDALNEEVGALAERVRVLERTSAVDEFRLAAEIEGLRDPARRATG